MRTRQPQKAQSFSSPESDLAYALDIGRGTSASGPWRQCGMTRLFNPLLVFLVLSIEPQLCTLLVASASESIINFVHLAARSDVPPGKDKCGEYGCDNKVQPKPRRHNISVCPRLEVEECSTEQGLLCESVQSSKISASTSRNTRSLPALRRAHSLLGPEDSGIYNLQR
jgi:hypothetical protein